MSPHGLYRTGHLGVIATVAALNDADTWLAEVLEVLDRNRVLLAELLDKHLPAARYTPPQASFLAWIDFRALGWGDDPAAHILGEAKVALNSGHRYGFPGFARLNFGCAPETLTEAVIRIAESC
ncbi:hypothetical protein ACFU6R_22225 [Streptomyces sp. NPDC057499]|uniref:hypothetical protein n=1 Tax=Streptomyces sp. NPDC057499 TaxID=3346150 RepID=UPI0036AE93A0